MAKPVLIVFAKAPRLGLAKQRLAAEIGQLPALRIARALLAATLRRLRPLANFERVLALTPDRARLRPPPGWTRINQGPGDLGARMHSAFRRFPRRLVILVGADIPALAPADIRAAAQKLRGHHAVFGPAADGGYYLVAMAGLRPTHPFASTSWSSPHALADTTQNFAARRITKLRILRDLDTAADLTALAQETGLKSTTVMPSMS